MNLKNRLENFKQLNVITVKTDEIKAHNLIMPDVFLKGNNEKNILLNMINNNKNIVFINNVIQDNLLIANYMKSVTENLNTQIVKDFDDINSSIAKICIFPSPEIEEIIKMFEYIIKGKKSFIFGINMKNPDNVAEKLKALTALHYKNMTEKNINTLFASSDLVFVYINKNNDNLYFISEIQELNYINSELFLNPIYVYKETPEPCNEENASDIKTEPEEKKELNEENSDNESNQEENEVSSEKNASKVHAEESEKLPLIDVIQKEEDVTEQEITQITDKPAEKTSEYKAEKETKDETEKETIDEIPKVLTKVNKYKLLKEKIKNKQKDE